MVKKSNPLFTRSEKSRIKRKVSHSVRGGARKGISKLFGIPLSRGLGGAKSSSRTRAAKPAPAARDESTVRRDVISALINQGYTKTQAESMTAVPHAGESFDSLFRRVIKKNPAELVIFGNPEKVYRLKKISAAMKAGNPLPLAVLEGIQWGLGEKAVDAVTSKPGRKARKSKPSKSNPEFCDGANRRGSWRQRGRGSSESKRVNPDAESKAKQLFETFHHRESSGVFDSQRSAKARKDFTMLGPLVAIGVGVEDYDEAKGSRKDWDDYKVEQWDKLPHLSFLTDAQVKYCKSVIADPQQYVKDCPQLASSPNGKQLYAITPDGVDVDLSQFDTDASKDFVDLGDATFIVYIAKKPDEPVEWVHEFGEDGGTRPRLILNRLGKKELFFTGGSYSVQGPGIID